MHWYLDVLKKYAVFSGRARRTEYWMFILFNAVIGVVLSLIEGSTGMFEDSQQSVLVGLYQLGVLLPTIGVSIRRMHDTDHSGWWILVPIVNLIFAMTNGTPGPNCFGPDPKAAPVTA